MFFLRMSWKRYLVSCLNSAAVMRVINGLGTSSVVLNCWVNVLFSSRPSEAKVILMMCLAGTVRQSDAGTGEIEVVTPLAGMLTKMILSFGENIFASEPRIWILVGARS